MVTKNHHPISDAVYAGRGQIAILQEILGIVCTGGVHNLRQLAQHLDVSQALLESMIEGLVRMGYVKPLEATCVDSCESCAMALACNIPGSGHVWVLTEAGRKMAHPETG